jgi:hypothetical protein
VDRPHPFQTKEKNIGKNTTRAKNAIGIGLHHFQDDQRSVKQIANFLFSACATIRQLLVFCLCKISLATALPPDMRRWAVPGR